MSSNILIRNDEYQIEEIDGELLLYHAGKTETLYLNESAAMVWYLCNGKMTQSEMIKMFSESYPEHAETMAADIDVAVQAFIEFGGLTIS